MTSHLLGTQSPKITREGMEGRLENNNNNKKPLKKISQELGLDAKSLFPLKVLDVEGVKKPVCYVGRKHFLKRNPLFFIPICKGLWLESKSGTSSQKGIRKQSQ